MMNSAMISLDSSQPSCSPRSSASCSEPMAIASAVKPNQSKRSSRAFFVSSMKIDEAEHGKDAERQVDEEHPVPGIGLGQPGAERRAHDRPHHHAHAPDRHRFRPLLQRCRSRASPPATAAPAPRRTRPAAGGTPPSGVMSCASPHITEAMVKPAEQMMKMRLRPKRLAIQPTGAVMIAAATIYGRQHPVDLVLRRRQRALHVGQRDVGDGGVQRLHDRRRHGADRHHVPAQAGNGSR